MENFFHAHRHRMVEPYPRYAELLARRAGNGVGLSARAQASQFTVDDLRDLQVWHTLVWIDQLYWEGDARVRGCAKWRASPRRSCPMTSSSYSGAGRSRVPRASSRGQSTLTSSLPPNSCAAVDTHVYLQPTAFAHAAGVSATRRRHRATDEGGRFHERCSAGSRGV